MARYYKTIVRIVVLTDNGPLDDSVSLADIGHIITEGGGTGEWEVESSEELSRDRMRDELVAIGSSPEFFLITE